jgi:alpha-1,2-mannosyltransferase
LKKKWPSCVALVLAAAVVLAGAYIFHIHKEMTDFGVCYQGGQRIVRGETLYREADGHLQFKYSPAAAVCFAPLAILPYEAAKVVWYMLELIFLAGILFFCWRMLPSGATRAAPLFIWTFLIELKFLARELELGQVNLLILFCLTLMIYFIIRGKEGGAGLLWGGSLLFKPYALVFLPYFLIKKRFRALVAGIAASAAGLALPVAFYGLKGNLAVLKEWPATLSKSTSGLLASFDNASLYGFLLKAFPSLPSRLSGVLFLTILLALAIVVLWLVRAGRAAPSIQNPEALESAFLLILIPLFSPLGWNYNYLYSLPAVMLILNSWRRFPRAAQIILSVNFIIISTSLIEIWGRELFHFYTHYALVVLNFLIVLASLAYLRAKNTL